MSDLEITKKCAEAMGFKHYTPEGGWTFLDNRLRVMTKESEGSQAPEYDVYTPQTNDGQAFAMVKKFDISCEKREFDTTWSVHINKPWSFAQNADLNRAICECVAKMVPR